MFYTFCRFVTLSGVICNYTVPGTFFTHFSECHENVKWRAQTERGSGNPEPNSAVCFWSSLSPSVLLIKFLADDFRVWICVRLFIQNMIKSEKIGKSVECENYVLMVSYGKLRKQGSLEVMPVNHFVRGSSPCWAKIQNGRFSSEKRPFVFGIECFFLRAYQMVFRS